MTELKLIIAAQPPSVNHYIKHTRTGRHYKTSAAESWHLSVLVAVLDSGAKEVEGKAHEVSYTVFQGKGDRGDVDNYAKCILDALVATGVLKSDASITDLRASKRRDRENPRTEITVRAI